mmetsp:Transcript_15817/g.36341  ORF Transcript_15817/g.36341 Transcript_15817/m.36341 type:complete len:236 (-) Transcript_15817:426-1133(-)
MLDSQQGTLLGIRNAPRGLCREPRREHVGCQGVRYGYCHHTHEHVIVVADGGRDNHCQNQNEHGPSPKSDARHPGRSQPVCQWSHTDSPKGCDCKHAGGHGHAQLGWFELERLSQNQRKCCRVHRSCHTPDELYNQERPQIWTCGNFEGVTHFLHERSFLLCPTRRSSSIGKEHQRECDGYETSKDCQLGSKVQIAQRIYQVTTKGRSDGSSDCVGSCHSTQSLCPSSRIVSCRS